MFGLGERQLQVLGEGAREVVAAQRNRPLPDDAVAVGDDQVGVVRADVERDDAALLAASLLALGGGGFFQQIVRNEIAQCQRRHLHDLHFDVHILEVLQVAVHGVALDGEQADLGLHGEAVRDHAGAEFLIIPDHLFEIERDLLLGFEADDVVDLFLFDRRQLDETGQAALAGDADGDQVAFQVVAR